MLDLLGRAFKIAFHGFLWKEDQNHNKKILPQETEHCGSLGHGHMCLSQTELTPVPISCFIYHLDSAPSFLQNGTIPMG